MAKQQTQGGKKGRKIGRNKAKCALYAASHGIPAGKKRFRASKEHRSCGPIGRYLRRLKELEARRDNKMDLATVIRKVATRQGGRGT